jgi:Sec-independent protein secretion pathway component TatC
MHDSHRGKVRVYYLEQLIDEFWVPFAFAFVIAIAVAAPYILKNWIGKQHRMLRYVGDGEIEK